MASDFDDVLRTGDMKKIMQRYWDEVADNPEFAKGIHAQDADKDARAFVVAEVWMMTIEPALRELGGRIEKRGNKTVYVYDRKTPSRATSAMQAVVYYMGQVLRTLENPDTNINDLAYAAYLLGKADANLKHELERRASGTAPRRTKSADIVARVNALHAQLTAQHKGIRHVPRSEAERKYAEQNGMHEGSVHNAYCRQKRQVNKNS